MNDICKRCNKEFENTSEQLVSSDPNKHICNECLQKVYENLIQEIYSISNNIQTFERYHVMNELDVHKKIYNILMKILNN